MRRTFVCTLVLLLGASAAPAQQWAAPGGYYPAAVPPTYGYNGYYPTVGQAAYSSPTLPYGTSYPMPYPTAMPDYTSYYGNYTGYGNGYATPQSVLSSGIPDPSTAGGAPADSVGAAPPGAEVCYFPQDLCTPPEDDHKTEGPPPGDKCGWLSLGYLAAFPRQERLGVPLLSTGPANNPAAGVVGQNGTVVLFGQGNINFNRLNGIQIDAGLWLNECRSCSLDMGGFYLFPSRVSLAKASDATGNPVLVRPIFDVVDNTEAAFIVAFPGLAAGNTAIITNSEMFGVELNGGWHFDCSCHVHGEALFGFRFVNLDERIEITDNLMPLVRNRFRFLGAVVNPPNTLADNDAFKGTNQFYGLQVGGRLCWDCGPLTVSGFAKSAFGLTDETVVINGTTFLITPTGTRSAPGGILAQASNIGTHHRVVFGVVPECGLDLAWEITKHISVQAGYSFFLWSAVARPGSQIDRGVNPNQVPTNAVFNPGPPARPAFAFQNDLFWMQTLHVGVDIHY
jgi:hypothetical protein